MMQLQHEQGAFGGHSPSGQRKKVRFEEEEPCVVEHEPLNLTDEERAALHFSRQELHQIRQEARVMAAHVIQKQNPDQHHGFCLLLERISTVCAEGRVPDRKDVKCCGHWYKAHPARRGLEIITSPTFTEHKKRRYLDIRKIVFAAQLRHADTLQQKQDLIARASDKISRPSRTLARVMAIIDLQASKEEEPNKPTKRPSMLLRDPALAALTAAPNKRRKSETIKPTALPTSALLMSALTKAKSNAAA